MLSATFQVPQNAFTRAARSAGAALPTAPTHASPVAPIDRLPPTDLAPTIPGGGAEPPAPGVPAAASTGTGTPKWLVPLAVVSGLAAAWFLFLRPRHSASEPIAGARARRRRR